MSHLTISENAHVGYAAHRLMYYIESWEYDEDGHKQELYLHMDGMWKTRFNYRTGYWIYELDAIEFLAANKRPPSTPEYDEFDQSDD